MILNQVDAPAPGRASLAARRAAARPGRASLIAATLAGWAALLAVALAAAPAAGHEGHDHGAPEPVAADPHLVVRSASNDDYEVVLKFRSLAGERSTVARVYVSDYATNAPIPGARVDLRATLPRPFAVAAAEASPGVYQATLAFGDPGRYTMILSIGPPRSAEFAFQDLPLGERLSTAPAAGPEARAGRAWWWALLVAAGALAAGLVARRLRRPLSRSAAALAIAGSALLVGRAATGAPERPARDAPPPSPAGATAPGTAPLRYLPKEAQFLHGVRTLVARLEPLRARVAAVGHVVPESGALAVVEAPRDGKLEPAGRRLAVGDRVRAGQTIGHLLVIDRLPIRAPISGLVAEVHYTPGQWVHAGDRLLVILDERQVRVELPLFGENLQQALGARTATVTSSALPGVSFPARVRGLAPTAPEPAALATPGEPAAGAPIPPVLLSVANRGGLLRPGMLVEASLELPGERELIAVPEAAVVQQEGGALVFVHTAPEVFEQRAVRVVGRFGARVGLAGEVRPGDRIVVEGAPVLVSAPPVTTAGEAGAAR